MKTINETTTNNLFNEVGLLQAAGDYAGKYQQQAFDLLTKEEDDYAWEEDAWADIMHDNKGKCYAVFAEGELTSLGSKCYYMEIEREDCEDAYDEAQTHIE